MNTALALFFASFAAATLLPLSSEAALVAALQSDISKTTALLAASAGNILAIIVNYWLGYFLFERTRNKLFASKTGTKAFAIAHRYGYWALLLSWLPVIGDPITLVAGLVRMNFFYFLLIAAALRIGRYALIIWLS